MSDFSLQRLFAITFAFFTGLGCWLSSGVDRSMLCGSFSAMVWGKEMTRVVDVSTGVNDFF